MAKSSRSSSRKHNNQRLKANVFGPAESARAERLSQRLLEIAKQPKPESSDVNMDVEVPAEEDVPEEKAAADETTMEVESTSKPSKARIGSKGIVKKRSKKAGIVFPKYGDRSGKKKGGGK